MILAQTASPSFIHTLLNVALALVVTVAVLALVVKVLQWFGYSGVATGKKNPSQPFGPDLHVVKMLPIAKRSYIAIVQIGDQHIVVGVTDSSISLLHTLENLPEDETDEPAAVSSAFADALQHARDVLAKSKLARGKQILFPKLDAQTMPVGQPDVHDRGGLHDVQPVEATAAPGPTDPHQIASSAIAANHRAADVATSLAAHAHVDQGDEEAAYTDIEGEETDEFVEDAYHDGQDTSFTTAHVRILDDSMASSNADDINPADNVPDRSRHAQDKAARAGQSLADGPTSIGATDTQHHGSGAIPPPPQPIAAPTPIPTAASAPRTRPTPPQQSAEPPRLSAEARRKAARDAAFLQPWDLGPDDNLAYPDTDFSQVRGRRALGRNRTPSQEPSVSPATRYASLARKRPKVTSDPHSLGTFADSTSTWNTDGPDEY